MIMQKYPGKKEADRAKKIPVRKNRVWDKDMSRSLLLVQKRPLDKLCS